MKRSFLVLLLTTLFYACAPEDHVLEIEIVNNASEPVQDLKVFTADDRVAFKADVLPPGEDIAHTLQVPGNFADGKYNFSFTRSNGNRETATGSYLEEDGSYVKKTLVFSIQEGAVNVDHRTFEAE